MTPAAYVRRNRNQFKSHSKGTITQKGKKEERQPYFNYLNRFRQRQPLNNTRAYTDRLDAEHHDRKARGVPVWVCNLPHLSAVESRP